MPHAQLHRTRGLELELRTRTRERRSCDARHPRLGPGANDVSRGRSVVVAERLDDESAALRLVGEIDIAALPELDHALRRMERWALVSLLVDATDVGFIDLGAVGLLAAAHGRLAATGGSLLVIHPPDCLLRILDVLDGEIDLPVLR